MKEFPMEEFPCMPHAPILPIALSFSPEAEAVLKSADAQTQSAIRTHLEVFTSAARGGTGQHGCFLGLIEGGLLYFRVSKAGPKVHVLELRLVPEEGMMATVPHRR
jgi:hypothetical protein